MSLERRDWLSLRVGKEVQRRQKTQIPYGNDNKIEQRAGKNNGHGNNGHGNNGQGYNSKSNGIGNWHDNGSAAQKRRRLTRSGQGEQFRGARLAAAGYRA